VKSLGVPLASRNLAQVSINLTDFEQTPVHRVFETVRREAERYGVSVAGSEIVGLIPKKALEMTAEYYLRAENFRPDMVFENRLEAARAGGGLNDFLLELAAPAATPGGGSAAAAAGAMAAALGEMVAGLAKTSTEGFHAARKFFTAAVERDSDAFRAVMAAYKLPKTERAPFVEEAMHRAAEVPMQVAERASGLEQQLRVLGEQVPERYSSDVATAAALAAACRAGAIANVRINLESVQEEGFRQALEMRLAGL
jgi:glutamate formiminotransferase / formiminotetrahydrofolate cyclodeaminase